MALVVDLADAARRAHAYARDETPVPWEAVGDVDRLAWIEAAIAVWARLILMGHGFDLPPAD